MGKTRVSAIEAFSDYVHSLHRLDRCVGPGNVAEFGVRGLGRIIRFDSAWYGWAEFAGATTFVRASSTLNLPSEYSTRWEEVAEEDPVARQLRRDPHRIGVYRLDQRDQSERMLAFAERFGLARIATAVAPRPGRTTSLFLSIYREDRHSAPWTRTELELLRHGLRHLDRALRGTVGQGSAGRADSLALYVDRTGVAVLGYERAADHLIRSGVPMHGDRLATSIWRELRGASEYRPKRSETVLTRADEGAADMGLMRVELRPVDAVQPLSPREREVASLLAGGASCKSVARTLGTSPVTVRNQTQSIYRKLRIGNRAQLGAAIERGRTPSTEIGSACTTTVG